MPQSADLYVTITHYDPQQLDEASSYLRDRFIEVLGVQAPLRRTRSGRVVAATPATPGAAPRRVTGWLQSRVERRWVNETTVNVGVWDVPYAWILEWKDHPFFQRTIELEAGLMAAMLSGGVG